MSNSDFTADALFLADLGYYDDLQAGKEARKNVTKHTEGTISSKDVSAVPNTERSLSAENHDQNPETVSGSCEYGTHCWALRNMSWVDMLTAMGSVLGGPVKSSGGPTVGDAQTAQVGEEWIEGWNHLGNEGVAKDEEESTMDAEAKSSVGERVCKPFEPVSQVPDWHPRCPHCEQPNEYGRTMCDPVLPRVCQGASR